MTNADGTAPALVPHPWNDHFEWIPSRAESGVLDGATATAFDRDGYVVVDDVIDAATIDAVRTEIDGFEAQTDALLRTQADGRMFIAESGAITFTPHLVIRSSVLRAFAAHRVFVGLGRDLIGPDVRLYWDQAVYKLPEKPRRFPWHQDNGYTFIEPQQYLTRSPVPGGRCGRAGGLNTGTVRLQPPAARRAAGARVAIGGGWIGSED